MTMRIRQLRAIPVAVPRRERFLPRTAHGETPVSQYVLIEIESEDGVVGLGEVTCSPTWNGEEVAGSTRLLREVVDDALRGSDASSWAVAQSRVAPFMRDRPFLRAGIEMACLDLTGRYLGVPVATLLGGAIRERIETKFVLPAREIQRVADMALDARQYGIAAVKVKVGTGIAEDIARVARVREIFGDVVRITVDANEGWQPHEARRAISALDDLGVAAIEQPLPRVAWVATAQLRTMTGAVLFGDEAIWTLADVLQAGQVGAFDAVSIYPGKCGGLRETLMLARAAGALAMPVVFGSNLELGIGSAALAHTIAACPELSKEVPSDLIGPLYHESSLVTDAGFVGWDHGRVPSGVGLGIELDRDAVERYRMDGRA